MSVTTKAPIVKLTTRQRLERAKPRHQPPGSLELRLFGSTVPRRGGFPRRPARAQCDVKGEACRKRPDTRAGDMDGASAGCS